jgi:hypothetical protein
MRFDFTMILAPGTDLSEDVAEALFEAGCKVAEVRIEAEALPK